MQFTWTGDWLELYSFKGLPTKLEQRRGLAKALDCFDCPRFLDGTRGRDYKLFSTYANISEGMAFVLRSAKHASTRKTRCTGPSATPVRFGCRSAAAKTVFGAP